MRNDFDLLKWAFLLAAGCIAFQLLVVLLWGAFICLGHSEEIIAGSFVCDSKDKIMDILDKTSASAMGFLAGLLAGKATK